MNLDREQLTSLSPEDLIRQRYTSDKSESKIALLCGKGNIAEQIYSNSELSTDTKYELFFSLLDLIDSETIEAEDLPRLIKKISYSESASNQTTNQYGSEVVPMMSWSGFEIVLHQPLKNWHIENSTHNLKHHFYHEIGHSISELGGVSLAEIRELFVDISIENESKYIQEIADLVDEKRLLKERFSELISLYFQSRQSEKPAQTFCALRVEAMPAEKDSSNQDKINEIIQESIELYKKMEEIWPKISNKLKPTKRQVLSTELPSFVTDKHDQDDEAIGSETNNVDQNQEATNNSAREPGLGDIEPATFPESPSLAEKQNHNEGFMANVGSVVKNFGEELNIIG